MKRRIVSMVLAAVLAGAALIANAASAAAFDPVPELYKLYPYTTPQHPPVVKPGPPVGRGLPAGSPDGGEVTGSTAANHLLLPGATVSALQFDATGAVTFSRSTTSDADGRYVLADLPAGDYWIQFYDDSDPKHVLQAWRSVYGFYPDGATVPITPGSSIDADGYLLENGSITGHVGCSDGCDRGIDYSKAVVDIYIAYQGLGFYPTAEQRATVGATGSFRFSFAQPGEYVAIVRYSGSDFGDAEIGSAFMLDEGETATIAPTLREVRPNLHAGNPLGTGPEANVYAEYWDFLQRTPSVDDIRPWLAVFQFYNDHQLPETPAAWMARNFVESDEYRLKRIVDAYQSILGRAPDAGGRAMWLTDMKLGYISTDDILKSLYESAEWYTNHGSTNTSSAKSLYNALLGRDGSAADYKWWGDLATTHGRNWVVDQFWMSDETTGDRVGAMYATYLGRIPDASGLANWKSIDLRVGDSIAREGIVSSSEYYIRAQMRFDVS
ncbi:DUF4214 domain-containing protein [Subtercola boreus]|uniref:DUF4214 domain-containing protein n=1 Tax=Subtercola boreus TaxID=120213 RepID=A0A3E0WCS8_9MICO|nr:DUF4214 domain-containing protein [Subtercola boreus]RFA20760.1 hypothetical protein B7R24_08285 [Subtercola boreus]RFA20875.1 hypothetical protein B7R23_08225 [Subtercola boreus]RFA27068.1 hypothetical protein B7R25_08350 [Subtercola boreus]